MEPLRKVRFQREWPAASHSCRSAPVTRSRVVSAESMRSTAGEKTRPASWALERWMACHTPRRRQLRKVFALSEPEASSPALSVTMAAPFAGDTAAAIASERRVPSATDQTRLLCRWKQMLDSLRSVLDALTVAASRSTVSRSAGEATLTASPAPDQMPMPPRGRRAQCPVFRSAQSALARRITPAPSPRQVRRIAGETTTRVSSGAGPAIPRCAGSSSGAARVCRLPSAAAMCSAV